MIRSRYISLTAMMAGAVLFSGCFDQSTAPDTASQSKTAAQVATSGTWTWAESPGNIVAFTGITPSNSGWALDFRYMPKPQGGWALRRYQSGASTIVPGGLTDLDIIGNNEIWGVNENGGVFRNITPLYANGGTWIQIASGAPARRVATGSNGAAFILTTESVPGGYKLYKYNGSGFSNISGGLTEIDVDNNGDLWGINTEGNVYRLSPGNSSGTWQWMSRMDNPVNIAAGNGKIFIMTVTPVPGGNQIKQWNGTSFVRITGGLLDIQVDAGGRLWGANDEHKIFNYRP